LVASANLLVERHKKKVNSPMTRAAPACTMAETINQSSKVMPIT